MIEETTTLEVAAANLCPCTNCGNILSLSEMNGPCNMPGDEIEVWYCDQCVEMIQEMLPEEEDFDYEEYL
jgi:hypothetical protein